jgi:hypothetical protein
MALVSICLPRLELNFVREVLKVKKLVGLRRKTKFSGVFLSAEIVEHLIR